MCHSNQETSDRCVKANCRSYWAFQNSTLQPAWQPHLRSQQIDNSRKDYREISWGAAAIFWLLISGYHRDCVGLSGKMEARFSSEFGTAELRENRTETISLPPLQLAPRTGLTDRVPISCLPNGMHSWWWLQDLRPTGPGELSP